MWKNFLDKWVRPESIYTFFITNLLLVILGYMSNEVVSGTISFELGLAGFYSTYWIKTYWLKDKSKD